LHPTSLEALHSLYHDTGKDFAQQQLRIQDSKFKKRQPAGSSADSERCLRPLFRLVGFAVATKLSADGLAKQAML
jgi:hypothetical protein